MGILNQQLIGGGNLENAKRPPFSDAIGPDDTAKPGYGGYTFAKDTEQQEVFGTTPAALRTGPQGGIALIQGESTQYGPVGFSRLSGAATTLLGEMSEMLKPSEGDAVAVATWTTEGGGSKIAHTIMSNNAMKSLKDRTTSGNVPNASGGFTPGYDSNNQYDLSSYTVADSPAVEAVAEVKAVAGKDAVMFRNTIIDEAVEEVEGVEAVAAVAAVEGGYFETFGKVPTVATGLRNLPPEPGSSV